MKPFEVEGVLAKNGFDSLDKIHISVDPISARNPGYCFIDFHDRETAERALSSLSATIYGRTLKVGPCEPKKPRERRGFQNEEATSRRWGDWNTRPNTNANGMGHNSGRAENRGPNWAIDHFEDVVRDHGGRRLYVGGLDKMIDQAQHQEELSQIFSEFKPYVYICKDVTCLLTGNLVLRLESESHPMRAREISLEATITASSISKRKKKPARQWRL